jgi:hypothetical protein
MNPEQYIQSVLVTESKNFIPLRERMSQDRNIRILHGAIGLCTESAELFQFLEPKKLDLVNLKEEAGDCFWYIGLIVDEFKFNPEVILQKSQLKKDSWALSMWNSLLDVVFSDFAKKKKLNRHIDELIKQVGLLQDLSKKSIFYGKVLTDDRFLAQVIEVSKQLATLCDIGDISITDCLIANIKKLSARYKGGFSEKAALDRDLAKERTILEQKHD